MKLKLDQKIFDELKQVIKTDAQKERAKMLIEDADVSEDIKDALLETLV